MLPVRASLAMAAPAPVTDLYCYQQGWTQEYRNHADVELIVEGRTLVAHSQLLCQSEVLEGAIRDTEQPAEKRIRIESLFVGTTVGDVDALLSQLYATTVGIPDNISSTKKLISLAMKCGFDRLVTRFVETLTSDPRSKHFRHLRSEWSEMLPGALRYWVDVCTLTENESLESMLIEFLVENYKRVFGSENWHDMKDSLCANGELCGKILREISLTL